MQRTVLALFFMVIVLGLAVIVQARVEVPKAVQQPMWSVWVAIHELQDEVDSLEARVAALEECTGCAVPPPDDDNEMPERPGNSQPPKGGGTRR